MSAEPSKTLASEGPPSASFQALTALILIAISLAVFVPFYFLSVYEHRMEYANRDVSEVAHGIETALANDPGATSFEYLPSEVSSNHGVIMVGDSPAVSVKAGTDRIRIAVSAVSENGTKVENGDPAAAPGEYVVEAYDVEGKNPTEPVATYDSRVGEVVVP